MAEIDVDICGQKTTIACAPEDEARLRQLIALVDERAVAAKSIVGDNDRWRQLLFAAIFLADELDTGGAVATPSAEDDASAARVAALADRIAQSLDRIDQAMGT
jgi:cell division protein ZapA